MPRKKGKPRNYECRKHTPMESAIKQLLKPLGGMLPKKEEKKH